jgi:zinc carboxypeptidase/type IX secretion system substrate protein/Big-like domain-containing protein
MHGDETTGFVLMLRFIDYLLSRYETDNYVKGLINDLEIYINPSSNPDGTYATSNDTICYYCSSRSNSRGVDLNRDYTEPRDTENPAVWEQENVKMIEFMKGRNITLSMNFHGGIEVINYPWDFTSTRHTDDAWFQLISREYADTAQFYSPSWYMDDYGGITNGYDWYYAGGTRQDYLNYYLHGREVTAEISTIKAPESSSLPNYWEYNYRSFLHYMKQATYGVHGVVTDVTTGDPIRAFIEVVDHDVDSSQVYSDETNGDYHRLIKAGTYTFLYSAEGYEQVSKSITIDDYETIIENVEMQVYLEINHPPVITDVLGNQLDTVNLFLEKNSELKYSFNVTDQDNDEVSLIISESLTDNTTINIINDTCIQITPDLDFLGTEWVKIVVADDGEPVSKDSIYLNILYDEEINHAPQIVNEQNQDIDSVFITEFKDSIIDFEFKVIDVDNDSTYLYSAISLTDNTAVTENNDTSIRITPNNGFIGIEQVKIIVSDTGTLALKDSLIVEIQYLEKINHAPRIIDSLENDIDSIYITSFRDSVFQVEILAVDSDEDNISIIEVSSIENIGVASFNQDALLFTYTPLDSYIGNDYLKVKVSDDGDPIQYDSVIVVVSLINYGDNPPLIIDTENQSIDTLHYYTFQDSSIQICINAIDVDDDEISLSKWETISNNGSVNLSSNNLCLEYEPETLFIGNDSFIVWVCDNSEFELCDSVIVIIDVKEKGNNPPVITDINGASIDEIYVEHIGFEPLELKMYYNDIDYDQVSICTVFSLNNLGTIDNISNQDSTFTYQPKLNYYGIDSVKAFVCDNSFYDLKDSVMYIFNINREINHAPIIVDQLGNELDTMNVGIYSDSLAFICINALDIDDDEVSINELISITDHGILNFTSYPLCYIYHANEEFVGIDTYKVVVCDDNEESLCDTLVVNTNIEQYISVFENDFKTVQVYPNPFNNEITIRFEDEFLGKGLVSIFNISGTRVCQTEIKSSLFKFDTSELEVGMYFIIIQTNEQNFKMKMIKQF